MFRGRIMELNVANARLLLEEKLKEANPKKYQHSLGVADIAAQLAKKWRINVEEAVIAALLHDIGKSMDRKEMVEFCRAHNIKINDFEENDNQEALHGKISAHFFKAQFGNMNNKKENNKRAVRKIAHAIESHVAGSKKMSLLDQIVFLADNIESKKGKEVTLEKILKDKRRRPGYYIGKIVDRKIRNAREKGRFPNPGLLDMIPVGPEGNPRRERFAATIKVIAAGKINLEKKEDAVVIITPEVFQQADRNF